MRDPECEEHHTEVDNEGADSHALHEWVFLPTLLQQFVDKHFASYQLNLHEARTLLESGKIKQAKYDKIADDSVKPLLLMHGTGQPATAKYMKEHLLHDKETKELKVKESRQQIISNSR